MADAVAGGRRPTPPPGGAAAPTVGCVSTCTRHTMWSGDSTTTPDEIAAAVVDSGLDVLCITDHNAIDGARGAGAIGCRAG